MPVPSPRDKILPVRGNIATLQANVLSLVEGEICYALDEDQYYQKESGSLVAVGATKAQGILADSATQPGDNISTLTNDSAFVDAAGASAAAPVQSVFGRTGAVVAAEGDYDLDELGDVDLTTTAPVTNDVLQYNGSAWVPVTGTSLGYWNRTGTVLSSVNTGDQIQLTGALDVNDQPINTTVTDGDIDLDANGAGLIRVTEFNLSQVPIVTQHDIGTDANEVPLNGMLGGMAFQDPASVVIDAGTIGVNSGTAADPSLSFSGDPNTGLYSPGADQVAISTASTERMRITSTGDLLFNSGYGSAATAYGCRAWVNFDGNLVTNPGTTTGIRGSGNVSSVTDNGTGDYTVNFTTAMPDTNFAYVCSVGDGDHTSTIRTLSFISSTTSTLRILSENTNGTNTDEDQIGIAIFR